MYNKQNRPEDYAQLRNIYIYFAMTTSLCRLGSGWQLSLQMTDQKVPTTMGSVLFLSQAKTESSP